MAITQAYLGTNRIVSETDEEDWGPETTAYLVDLLKAGNVRDFKSAALNYLSKAVIGADLTIGVGATITWTHNHHVVTGDGAPVTVDATTGISAGEADRQPLRLVGGSDTNTVTIVHAGNVDMNGAVVLKAKHYIDFEWDLTDTKWVEVGRSN